MKNALTRKIIAAVATLFVVTSLAGCSMYAEDTAGESSSSDIVSAADVSASDVVSGADVSGSDVVVVDDATLADNALNAYFAALNSGDVDKLVELTANPPMVAFLTEIGADTDYLRASFQTTIDGMKTVSGGYSIAHEYTVAEATEDELNAIKTEMDALSAGAGEKVQAARIYKVSMKAYAADMAVVSGADVVSSADVVSGADAAVTGELLEEADSVIRLFKYDGRWYVLGE